MAVAMVDPGRVSSRARRSAGVRKSPLLLQLSPSRPLTSGSVPSSSRQRSSSSVEPSDPAATTTRRAVADPVCAGPARCGRSSPCSRRRAGSMLVTRWSGRTSAPLLLRERQVVAVERVLGVDVAADVAVAEMHAGALLDAVRIDERLLWRGVEGGGQRVVPFGVEVDGELELLEARTGADRPWPPPASAASSWTTDCPAPAARS